MQTKTRVWQTRALKRAQPINFNLYVFRLKQDRLRQEQLARERLAQLRERRKAKQQEAEDKLVTDGDMSVLQEAVMKALEHKHQDERQVNLGKMKIKKSSYVEF